MFERFSSNYFFGRLYVGPYDGAETATHRTEHERSNECVYTDGYGVGWVDYPLVMKLDTTHFPVVGDDGIPSGTLTFPRDVADPNALPDDRPVLLADTPWAIELLRYADYDPDGLTPGGPGSSNPDRSDDGLAWVAPPPSSYRRNVYRTLRPRVQTLRWSAHTCPCMLDELLGWAELKARITELEDECGALVRRLKGESKRRAEAARVWQEAEVKVNRFEDRITELEDHVERLSDDDDLLGFRGTEGLRGDCLREVLPCLDLLSADEEGALTVTVSDDRSLPSAVGFAFGGHAPLVRRAAPCVVLIDDAEVVSVAFSPPRQPDDLDRRSDGFDLDSVRFHPTETTVVAFVRGDLFAFGRYEDGDLEFVEGFENDVKSAHSKGGSLQGWFERAREGQTDDHINCCHEALDKFLGGGSDAGERAGDDTDLAVLGERAVLSEPRDQTALTATIDASGDPETTLTKTSRGFWAARLYRLWASGDATDVLQRIPECP